jgi:hypothetical protein
MSLIQHISPGIPLPSTLVEVAGLVAESYLNPLGREFLVIGVWGKTIGREQVLHLGWTFSDASARAGKLDREPRWEMVRLPSEGELDRGILNAELSLYQGQIRAIVTSDYGDGNVRRQQLHIITLISAGIED